MITYRHTCRYCKSEFERPAKPSKARYCSRECYRAQTRKDTDERNAGVRRRVCLGCGKPYDGVKTRKYCSGPCSYKHRPVHRERTPEQRRRISEALMGHFSSPEVRRAISEANTYKVSDKELNAIRNVWNLRYKQDSDVVLKLAGVKFGAKVYRRIRDEHKDEWLASKPIMHLPSTIQSWDPSQMDALLEALRTGKSRAVGKQFNVGEKTLRRIMEAHTLPWIRSWSLSRNKSKSTDHIVRALLVANGQEFVEQFEVGGKIYDFKVRNTLIEVHGDYWHANPKKYAYPVTRQQIRNVANDVVKQDIAQSHGFALLVIWEDTLTQDVVSVAKALKEIE